MWKKKSEHKFDVMTIASFGSVVQSPERLGSPCSLILLLKCIFWFKIVCDLGWVTRCWSHLIDWKRAFCDWRETAYSSARKPHNESDGVMRSTSSWLMPDAHCTNTMRKWHLNFCSCFHRQMRQPQNDTIDNRIKIEKEKRWKMYSSEIHTRASEWA